MTLNLKKCVDNICKNVSSATAKGLCVKRYLGLGYDQKFLELTCMRQISVYKYTTHCYVEEGSYFIY